MCVLCHKRLYLLNVLGVTFGSDTLLRDECKQIH